MSYAAASSRTAPWSISGSEPGTTQYPPHPMTSERDSDSEARFRSLAELSSDWYWEQDEQFRFTSRWGGQAEHQALLPDHERGLTRWELPTVGVSAEQWAAHRALLEAHLPFRDFVYQRRDECGRLRHVSVSGHPVYDEQGRFSGYRGIGKDLTESKRGEQLLALGT